MKPGPIILMILLPLLGVWLIMNRPSPLGDVALRDGARTFHLRIANSRGLVEVVEEDDGSHTFRILMGPSEASPILNDYAFQSLFGRTLYQRVTGGEGSWLFELLNITSWSSLIWVAIGFGGQAVFMSRFLIQWIISEKKRESVIPTIFWWISLAGAVCLFVYFVWRRDIVGVLGQSTGVVIYARNLRLIHKQRRRALRAAAREHAPSESGDP